MQLDVIDILYKSTWIVISEESNIIYYIIDGTKFYKIQKYKTFI